MAMKGTKENPVELGRYWRTSHPDSGSREESREVIRIKLPHGWLMPYDEGVTFVPWGDNGTGWGPNDPADLTGRRSQLL